MAPKPVLRLAALLLLLVAATRGSTAPLPEPIPPLAQCLTNCGTKVVPCVTDCTKKEELELPACVLSCGQVNLACLFSCVHVPLPIPTPPPPAVDSLEAAA